MTTVVRFGNETPRDARTHGQTDTQIKLYGAGRAGRRAGRGARGGGREKPQVTTVVRFDDLGSQK